MLKKLSETWFLCGTSGGEIWVGSSTACSSSSSEEDVDPEEEFFSSKTCFWIFFLIWIDSKASPKIRKQSNCNAGVASATIISFERRSFAWTVNKQRRVSKASEVIGCVFYLWILNEFKLINPLIFLLLSGLTLVSYLLINKKCWNKTLDCKMVFSIFMNKW